MTLNVRNGDLQCYAVVYERGMRERFLKLYSFGEWNKKKRTIRLSEWETDEYKFRKEFAKVQRGWVVLDVGSEFGYYAIEAGHLVGGTGKVFAIEVHPETYRVLLINIRLHDLTDCVFPICRAVGKETGTVKLFETTSPGSTSIVPRQSTIKLDRNRLRIWLNFAKSLEFLKIIRKRYAPVQYVVPMNTLDEIADECGIKKVDLIKIDVEGAEMDVLKGSQQILQRDRPVLLVEVHFGWDWKPESLYALLRTFGYDLEIEKREQKSLVIARPSERAL